jgi:hypothetical protein
MSLKAECWKRCCTPEEMNRLESPRITWVEGF